MELVSYLQAFEHIFLHSHDMLFLVYPHFTCSCTQERNISCNHPMKAVLSHRNNPIIHLSNMVNHPTKEDLNHHNNRIIHLSSRMAHNTRSNPCINHLHERRGAGPGSGLFWACWQSSCSDASASWLWSHPLPKQQTLARLLRP